VNTVTHTDVLLEVRTIKGAGPALLLHNEISQVCETWWKQDRTQKERLVPQTISYLIAQVRNTALLRMHGLQFLLRYGVRSFLGSRRWSQGSHHQTSLRVQKRSAPA
jgi:hypothetical protein